MASARRGAARASNAARAAGTNPYIQRLVQDAALREEIREALALTRSAYGRIANGKAPAKALMEDKKLQRDLRDAATSLRDIGITLREGPKRKRKRRLGRMILVAVVGGGLAIALSEGLRKKVLDALFGAEEEFEYTSTTTPSSAGAGAPVGTS
jgi:hypothetical protein